MKSWVKYFEFMKVSFLTYLAYRFQVAMGFVSVLLIISLNYFLWKAIYAHHQTIAGFRLDQMLTYVVVGWSARSFFSNRIDRTIGNAVRDGSIAMDLLKPMNFQLYHYARAFGRAAFTFLFVTAPMFTLCCFIFPVEPPSRAIGGLLFPLSLTLSFFLTAGINYLTGLLAFYTQNNEGILHAKMMLIEMFSGILIPISFFPTWVQSVLYWLPFKYIAYAPLRIYLGMDSVRKVHQGVLLQLMWITIIFFSGQILWHFAIRRGEIQGG